MRKRVALAATLLIGFLAGPALFAATYSVSTTADSGAGSLRQAIVDANANPGPDTIAFSIGSGVQTIRPLTPLQINGPATIDGTTQPGFAGLPLVEVKGDLLPNSASVLMLNGAVTVKSLTVNRAPAYAIYAYGAGGATILDCHIGTNPAGTAAQPNGLGGIRIEAPATIRGNLISGSAGIWSETPTGPIVIAANRLGTDLSGNPVMPNVVDILIANCAICYDLVIGGAAAADRNVMASGLVLSGVNGGTVAGNRIGAVLAPGAIVTRRGISLGATSNITIERNTITNKVGEAIASFYILPFSSANRITNNSIFGNRFGIDLVGNGTAADLDGPTANDPLDADTGPGGLQNHPVVTVSSVVEGTATIGGTLHSKPSSNYTIDVYASPSCHSSGYGEGKTFIGSVPMTTNGLGNGTWRFTGPSPVPSGQVITATARDAQDNTSEFSLCRTLLPGMFRFDSHSRAVSEDATEIVIGIVRDDPLGAASVRFMTHAGSALAGSDYVGVDMVVQFADGETVRNVGVTIVSDAVGEPNESFTASLTAPAGGPPVGDASPVAITIQDLAFPPRFHISADPQRIAEGHSGTRNARFTFSITNPVSVPVVVDYVAAANTATPHYDYLPTSGTFTIEPGDTFRNVDVPIIGDGLREDDEYFSMVATSVSNVVIGNNSAIAWIDNDDPALTVSIGDASVVEGHTGQRDAIFNVTIGGGVPTGDLPVSYAMVFGSAGASDFQSTNGTVTFQAGQTSRQIVVKVNGDYHVEADETFFVELSNSNATIVRGRGEGRILDDDVYPSISMSDAVVVEGDSGRSKVTLTLTSPAPFSGVVHVFLNDGTAKAFDDFVSAPRSVDFSNEMTKTVELEVYGDTEVEPDEDFFVRLFTFSGPPIVRDRARVVIKNDDLGFGPPNQLIARGKTGVLIVTFGQAAGTPQTIHATSNDPAVASVPGTIAVGPNDRSALITVTGVSAPGTARITLVLPAALGGETVSAPVRTYIPARLVFTPPALTLFAGQSIEVHTALDVPHEGELIVPLSATVGGQVEVPPSVTLIDGRGSFIVNARASGGSAIVATLPRLYGGQQFAVYADVSAAPAGPAILGLAPSTGPVAGGTAVEIRGRGLSPGCLVSFGGIPAATTFAHDQMLIAVTSFHAAATVDVQLACGADRTVLASGFTFLPATPAIRAISPSFGNEAGGTLVAITGTNLHADCGAFFDGVAAHTRFVDPAEGLVAAAPTHAAGDVAVTVKCGDAFVSAASTFTYTTAAEPSASVSATPLSGRPGQSIELAGARFRLQDRITAGDLPLTILETTPGAHTVRIPELPQGDFSITLADPSGRVTTTAPILTVLAAETPRIDAASASAGVAGAEIVLTGRGFRPAFQFAVGSALAEVVSWDYERVMIRVPASAARGVHTLRVVQSGENVAAGPAFEVLPTGLAATLVSPACTGSEGDVEVIISGRGFTPGADVTIGGARASNVHVIDDTTIRATVPAGTAGLAQISVSVHGRTATLTNAFRYVSQFSLDRDACGGRRRGVVR